MREVKFHCTLRVSMCVWGRGAVGVYAQPSVASPQAIALSSIVPGDPLQVSLEVSLGADSSLVLSAGNSTYCRPLQPTLPCLGLETQGRILGQL